MFAALVLIDARTGRKFINTGSDAQSLLRKSFPFSGFPQPLSDDIQALIGHFRTPDIL